MLQSSVSRTDQAGDPRDSDHHASDPWAGDPWGDDLRTGDPQTRPTMS